VRATHSSRLERWLGAESVEALSRSMRGWYGPPIAVAGVPGLVYACGDGDFCGPIRGGHFANLTDYYAAKVRRVLRNTARRQHGKLNAGFASLSDLISEATTGGKSQNLTYLKTTVALPAVAASHDLWGVGALPAAGANAAAAPGGTQYTNATSGALFSSNAAGGDTLHLTTWTGLCTAPGTLLLYDRLFAVNINHATTANTVTGTLARHNGTTGSAAGNFLTGRVTTVLGATAHNVTVTYVDNAGNAAEAAAAQAIRVSSAVNTIPLTQPQWFVNLNAGDSGLRNVTSIALSAASTGNVDWTIGQPKAVLPHSVANVGFILDGINSAFNLVQILDNACLSLLNLHATQTGAVTYQGRIQLVSG
jgi:hypothetical protein